MNQQNILSDWRQQAIHFEQQLSNTILGQQNAIRNVLIAVFSRGHVLLEGTVGVGKTTLLRTVAHGLGGDYQRIEGTIDLMPSDLIYYTHLDRNGKPSVDPGSLLQQGERLATFFFNEINRARPQVHSLLLRVMAERSITAFNQEYQFPHLQVFADRNPVEKEETFELPAAARDRFMMEIKIDQPNENQVLEELIFNPRFHHVDQLIADSETSNLPYYQLNEFAELIQTSITPTPTLKKYVVDLFRASHQPFEYGIQLHDVDMKQLLIAGASPRGMSFLIRAARVHAWLNERDMLLPEDIQNVFHVIMKHRLLINPIYMYRQDELLTDLLNQILHKIAAP